MTDLDDGIYFKLPQEEYHALPRLSASGVCNLLISPATFWADSWLNPRRKKLSTSALLSGTAYHHARLEPEIFKDLYYRGLDMRDYPDALTSHSEIKEALKFLGAKQTLTGEKVFEAAIRLRQEGYAGAIKHLLEYDHAQQYSESQVELPPDLFDEIADDMEALHSNGDITPYLTNGQAEVSVLWTDKLGVKWKARIDYLQVNRVVDMKTFDNSKGKVLEQAIYDTIQYNRYYVQAFVYHMAAELIRAGELKIRKVTDQAQKDLINAIRQSPDVFEYHWIWQEKKGVPNVLARRLVMTEQPHPSHLAQAPDDASRKALAKKLQTPSLIWKKAELEVRFARDLLLKCLQIWPTGRWGSLKPVDDITDEGFNPRFLES